MSSLESCFRKAGPVLNRDDKKAIRAIRDDLVKAGTTPTDIDVNQMAVDEYIDILQSEKDFIMQQVEGLGGITADRSLSPSAFAMKSTENLDKAAKVFPQKGIYRPEAEMTHIDYKTGEVVPKRLKNLRDPNVATRELVTQRTSRTIEMLYPDFYTLPANQVLAIASEFDAKAVAAMNKNVDIDTLRTYAGEIVADWITKNETLPLRYKIEDTFEREFVDAQPAHPLAAIRKYQAVLDEAEAVVKPGNVRSIIDKVLDLGEMKNDAVLGALPQSKLPDVVPNDMPSVPAYTRTVKMMDAWISKIIETHHDLAKRWLKFNREHLKSAKILGEFMHASTLAKIDVPMFKMPPAAELKAMSQEQRDMWAKRAKDYGILRPFWDRLGDKGGPKSTYQQFNYSPDTQGLVPVGPEVEVSEAQLLYLAVRDTYNRQRDMLIHNLELRVEETDADGNAKAAMIALLRKQFEAGNITPYFPLKRFGKHVAIAKDKAGNVVAFIKRESRREREAWMQEMRKEGFYVKPFEEKTSDLEMMQSIDPDFVMKVTKMFEGTKILVDTEVGGEIETVAMPGSSAQDAIWQAYLRTLPEMSARNAYIHRKGRLGFTGDALRSFSDHSFHTTHQMAKLKFGHELSTHLKDAEEDAQMVLQRESAIRSMMETGERPEGFEDATIHEVLMANQRIAGPMYRKLYSRFKKEANDVSVFHEPSYIKARDKVLKQSAIDARWAVPMSNELQRRHNYNMNPTSGAVSTKLTALGFLWFLSTSPAAGVLNLTQTAISAYPALRAAFSGQGSGMELLKASKDFLSAPWMGMKSDGVNRMTAKLKNDKLGDKEHMSVGERAAMQEFMAIGIFSKTRTRELLGLSESGNAYSARQEQILEMTGYIFHKTEEMNRAVTALAAYRLARKKNSSNKSMSLQEQHDAAVLQAEELVEISHFDYTNTNRPRPMQGDIGRVVFLFRNYSLNMTYRLIRDFKDGVWESMKSDPNVAKEDRIAARTRFLGIIGMTTLFAGVGGVPMIWAVEMIANNLLGDDDDPRDVKSETRKLIFEATEKHIAEGWGETVAGAVMKGTWSQLTGADLSSRASLNNLWIREMPEHLKDDPRGMMSHLSQELMGPMWGMAMNVAGGWSDIGEGHALRGVEKMVPKFIGDGLKTLRFASQGAQTYNRDMILSPEQFTSPSLFMQAIGFAPTQLTTRYEQNRAIKDMETRLKNRRTDLMNSLHVAWRLEDRREATQAMKAIAEWNKAQPRYAITTESIKDGARSRSQYDMRTVGGVAVDKRLQYLQEQMRFTDRLK